MKNTIVLFVCALAIATTASCGDDSKSSSSSAFKIQPGDVSKFDTVISGTSYDVEFGDNKSGDYAIIFQKNINGTDYVGIAFGEDPKSNRAFKVYISWQSSTISSHNGSASVTVIDTDGTRYSNTNATINFTISGPTSNVYNIDSSDNITVTHNTTDKTLILQNANTIKAYLVQ
ncbi:MAG: hypothetical protein AB1444_07255 [Spirochaetota bacterium]